MLAVEGKTANQVLGTPDDLKFCSCMTLFEAAAPGQPAFARAIDVYYDGRRDSATLRLLA